VFATDLEPFDLRDIEAGLYALGTRPRGQYETAFPGTVKLIEAVKAANVLRMLSANNNWTPCGQCKDCKDPNSDIVQSGMVRIRDDEGNTSVRIARSQCYEVWRRSPSV
jgi:hypothetical protein